jgi:hypothetical protein
MMAWSFSFGSACFVIGSFPGYGHLVGPEIDAITFFVGSLLFTTGGALQAGLAGPQRRGRPPGRALWWAAAVQLVGTVFFNVSTFRAVSTALAGPDYDRLVWRPDAFGSICFLVSGVIAYLASARVGWLPARGPAGWWQAAVNLVGCVFFAVAAVAGHVVTSTGSMLDQAAANWNTGAGAACFLACAVGTLRRSGSAVDEVTVHTPEGTDQQATRGD